MECKLASELMMEYLDKTITNEDNIKLLNHIENCSTCKYEFSLLKETVDIIEEYEDVDIPLELENVVMSQIDINKYKKKISLINKIPFLFVGISLIILMNFIIIRNIGKLFAKIDFSGYFIKILVKFINFISITLPSIIDYVITVIHILSPILTIMLCIFIIMCFLNLYLINILKSKLRRV